MSNSTAEAASVNAPAYSISYIGIVGILIVFLVLALIALVCLWVKKRASQRALKEQRELYSANGSSHPGVDVDEEAARSTKGQVIVADSKRVDNADVVAATPVVEHDIPIFTRDKHVVEGAGFSWNSSVEDEVFYTEEGSQMGVRYSSSDFDNVDIFSRLPQQPRRKMPDSPSASLLGSIGRSHTIAAAPQVENPSSWTLRTLSLPASHHQPSNVDVRVESLSKGIGAVEPKPESPKHSYSPKFAFGNFSLAPWTQKPSRLSAQSNAFPTFVVPPSTPPPPLPLPVSLEETEEKTLIELRTAMKQAETKWSVGSYCPSAPPPPIPVPFQLSPSPPPPPPSPCPSPPLASPPSPSPKTAPPPPPPPPPPQRISQPPLPPTPPPSLPPFPSLPCKRLPPLILPGRPENTEEFRMGPGPLRRTQSKMRPLHWDKLKPESRKTMVWDNISDSMELDEEMIESLFGVTAKADSVKKSPVAAAQRIEILEPRKAHNIAIQLRARGLSRTEVCDALLEGDGLSQEILETLVKMAPTDEEATKFHEFHGDATLLGPADGFILGILQIPSAFERLHAMHYKACYGEDLHHIQDTITTLEMACKELKGSRTFTKLLEAVLKTGNRLNTGTFRGDAKAFKLDTLLKLADVKGVDGKTTLLDFVIQEIIKAEGARAARTSTSSASSSPASSPALSHFARFESFEAAHDDDDFRKIGMEVVRGIPSELTHVRKAGALDIQSLRLAVSKLHAGLAVSSKTSANLASSFSSPSSSYDVTDDVFREQMQRFLADAETEVSAVQRDLDLVLASVKDLSVYFYGEADAVKLTTQQPLKVFIVLREFLAMLEQACKDVTTKSNAAAASTPPRKK